MVLVNLIYEVTGPLMFESFEGIPKMTIDIDFNIWVEVILEAISEFSNKSLLFQ